MFYYNGKCPCHRARPYRPMGTAPQIPGLSDRRQPVPAAVSLATANASSSSSASSSMSPMATVQYAIDRDMLERHSREQDQKKWKKELERRRRCQLMDAVNFNYQATSDMGDDWIAIIQAQATSQLADFESIEEQPAVVANTGSIAATSYEFGPSTLGPSASSHRSAHQP